MKLREICQHKKIYYQRLCKGRKEKMEKAKKFKIYGEFYLGLLTFILFVILFVSTKFGTLPGIVNFLKDVSYLLVASIALYLVILTGNIDISAGTMMGLCGYMAA